MTFSSLALFVYDVARADGRSSSGWDAAAFADGEPASVLTCIGGTLVGNRSASTGHAAALFGADETTVVTWHRTDVHGYVERFAIAALTAPQLDHILALHDGYEQLRSAARTILPPPADDAAGGELLRDSQGSMLLLSCDPASGEEPLRAYVERFGCKHAVLVPCRMLDIVVMPPALPGQGLGCCWYRPSDCADSERKIHVPETVQDIARLHNARAIVAHMHARLTDLPLSRASASDYLRGAKAGSGLLRTYVETHADDRERATQELLEGRKTLEELERRRTESLIARAEAQGALRPLPQLTVNELRIPMYSRVTSAYDEAVEQYRRSAALLESREQAVRDLVRDFLSAEVATSNLRLQKRMERLTQLAVLAAVAAIIVGLTTDRMREALWIKAAALWDALAHHVTMWFGAP